MTTVPTMVTGPQQEPRPPLQPFSWANIAKRKTQPVDISAAAAPPTIVHSDAHAPSESLYCHGHVKSGSDGGAGVVFEEVFAQALRQWITPLHASEAKRGTDLQKRYHAMKYGSHPLDRHTLYIA